MKYIPKNYNLFDNLFDDFFKNSFFSENKSVGLKTDIVEKEKSYELQIEVPGFKKDDINIKLKDGYLSISAKTDTKKEEKDEKGNVIRRERYTGSLSRNYYLGNNILPEDIKASCIDGILKVDVVKKEEEKEKIESKNIDVE
jgi:HSP20 family molecular chaperone IbpA